MSAQSPASASRQSTYLIRTLGKGLLGLRVVSTRGGPLRPGAAFVRLLTLLVPFPLLSIAGQDDGPDDVWDVLAYLGLLAHSRVVTAAARGIDLRKDLPMMLPREVGQEKSR